MAQVKQPPKLDGSMLDQLESDLEDLRIAYERYFVGIDRVPPVRERERIDRDIKRMSGRGSSSAVLRFRLDGLRSRFVTYDQYWRRILRDIENGTYKRIVAEAERRRRLDIVERDKAKRMAEQRAAAEASGEAQPVGASSAPSAASTRPPPTARAVSPAAQTAHLPDGVDAQEARQLFKSFVSAKKAAGEELAGVSYGALVQRMSQELPKLREKYGEGVTLEVATDGGKVRLRAKLSK